jgi:hypothetical protein
MSDRPVDYDDSGDDYEVTWSDIDPRTVPPSMFDYDYSHWIGQGYDIDPLTGKPGPGFYS